MRTLAGYESKLSSASISKDTKYIITTSFDRTFRLWQRKDEKQDEVEKEQTTEQADEKAAEQPPIQDSEMQAEAQS